MKKQHSLPATRHPLPATQSRPRLVLVALLAFLLSAACVTSTMVTEIVWQEGGEHLIGQAMSFEFDQKVWDALEAEDRAQMTGFLDPLKEKGWTFAVQDGGRIQTASFDPASLADLQAKGWKVNVEAREIGSVTTIEWLPNDGSMGDLNSNIQKIKITIDTTDPEVTRYKYEASVLVEFEESTPTSGSTGCGAEDVWCQAIAQAAETAEADPKIKKLTDAAKEAGPPKMSVVVKFPGTVESATVNGSQGGTTSGNQVTWDITMDKKATYDLEATATGEDFVKRIEVVQVVQDEGNSVPLVAGKSTVARVFMQDRKENETDKPFRAELRAFRGSDPVGGTATLLNEGTFVRPTSVNRERKDDALNFKLPPEWTTAGQVKLEVELIPHDGQPGDKANKRKSVTVRFQERTRQFTVLYRRVCLENSDPGNCPSVEGVQKARGLMSRLYPLADDAVKYRELPVPPGVYKKPWTKYGFIAAAREYYHMFDAKQAGFADQLVIWLPNLPYVKPLGLSDGKWSGNDPSGKARTGRVVWVRDSSTSQYPFINTYAVAHEVGHNLGLQHPGTNDTAYGCRKNSKSTTGWWPDTYKGKLYRENGMIHEVGYDPRSKAGTRPDTNWDLMSYCAPPVEKIWISPFHYEKLFNGNLQPQGMEPGRVVATASGSSGGVEVGGSLFAPLSVPQGRQDGPSDYLIITGSASRDGSTGNLERAYLLPSHQPGDESDPDGNYCLRFDSGAGTSDFCFTLLFEVDDHEDETPLNEQAFSFKVPYPPGTTKVSLVHRERELSSLATGGGSPALEITSPQPGETWQGRQTLEWSASDLDTSRATYAVFYSHDGGDTWFPLETELTEPRITIDTDKQLAGEQTYFRVLASSGLDTARGEIGPINVPAQPGQPTFDLDAPDPPGADDFDTAGGTNLPVGMERDGQPTSPGGNGGFNGGLMAILLASIVGGALLIGAGFLLITRTSRRRAAAYPTAPPTQPQYSQPYQYPHSPPVYSPPPTLPPPVAPTPPPDPFLWAMSEHWRLRNELAAGRITPQQLEASLQQLTVRDALGRPWSIGAADGQWYMFDGQGWVRADPNSSG